MLIKHCKKNDSLSAESIALVLLARHFCLPITFLVSFVSNDWRASKACKTLSGLNNENWRYMLLASERDTLRCNKIKILLYLFIYMLRRSDWATN